jgi:hypothetical protein
MNFIFKIKENDSKNGQIVVKFCRQNAPKDIEEYESYAIDYDNLNFTNYDKFVDSVMEFGITIILKQLSEEPTLESNSKVERIESMNINENLNKLILVPQKESIYSYFEQELNKIEL